MDELLVKDRCRQLGSQMLARGPFKLGSWRGGNDSGVEKVCCGVVGEQKSLPTTYGTKYWHWLVWKVGAQATRVDIPPHRGASG